MKTKFNVTHIGGRSGTIEFPKDTVFNDSINYSIFEADKTCIEQIRRSNPCAQVYPFCIDEKNGEKDFTKHDWNGNNVLLFGSEGYGLKYQTVKNADFLLIKTLTHKI